jgi:3-deoxy-D-manno-octulosonate 8-phosphate phosphatase (KDO 8-P phosphatase)
MYYDQTGNEWKKFHTYDSPGVLFCHRNSIPVGIITGETTHIVENRAKKLNVDFLYQGVSNKLVIARQLCDKLNITLQDVAYIGDDINDIDLLMKVGYSAAPVSAPEYIKDICSFITKRAGGNGAFREFVETLLNIKKA